MTAVDDPVRVSRSVETWSLWMVVSVIEGMSARRQDQDFGRSI